MEERLNMMKSVSIRVGQVAWSYAKIIIAGVCLLIGLILIGISFVGDTVCYGVGLLGQKACNVFNILMGVDDKYSTIDK